MLLSIPKDPKEEKETTKVKLKLHAAVRAYAKIQQKLFEDNIFKMTRRHIIDEREEWLHKGLIRSKEIDNVSIETEEIESQRKEAKQTVERMNKC